MTVVTTGPVADLDAGLGDAVVTDGDTMIAYTRDQALLSPSGRPIAVVRARTVDDVVTTLQTAYRYTIPVVTRGAGTGLAGGANALEGCIVLSTEKMNRILEIDEQSRTATVEPGVINGDLATAAAERGLWYVPDPGSRAISTIGGNLATNAGGPCCAKYGVTGDHVARIKAVLADGRIIHTGAATRKNVAGLNLTQLLVGSEGTLAVIVEATMRLRRKPAHASTVVAAFADPVKAVDAVMAIQNVAEPSLVELMDHNTITAVNDMTQMGLDESAGALLLIQCDGEAAEAETDRIAEGCRSCAATELFVTTDPVESDGLMQARRVALTALERCGSTLLDDLAVPVPRLPHMLDAISRIADRHHLFVGTFGHAADGNLHPTIVFDAADPDASDRAYRAFDEMVTRCLALGGSITGEHGVGDLKRNYLETMVGTHERVLMGQIKAVFDPPGILNPGRAI
ncbi:FAD-linked oxidase C-terminal domain-containing protein [Rhodococcus oxybenzonivorans]|uniref:FAD-binding oxidoreductase n=1 Tax=Rhodococcus oxybenzonivorans TaxID=1990687 RepID=UPI0029549940|nr:FAD-linked oxidase C-terminal domain-containing protein [Rhodococcus oxybenzonivorans]MDV7356818.1 FAD-linked oxidase C-terminal domain-containing protein [Rhodococcus oxybenzonivorans]